MKAPEDMSREELEEEVAFLRDELGLSKQGARAAALVTAFGVTAMEAQLIAVLFGAKGRPVSNLILEERLETARNKGGSRPGFIGVYVCRLRKYLGPLSITNVWGQGYAMSPEGLAKVSAALEGAAA